jgi:hypothetical protein
MKAGLGIQGGASAHSALDPGSRRDGVGARFILRRSSFSPYP